MKLRSFRGGYRFVRFRGEPGRDVQEADVPALVRLSLKSREGAPRPLLVRPGETVEAGQVIARDDEAVSSPLVAPITGVVEKPAADHVVIRGDGSRGWRKVSGFSPDWKSLPVERIEELLYLSGASALGSSGIPTRFRSAPIAPARAADVIVTAAAGGEPFEPDVAAVLGDRGMSRVYEGLGILRRFMPRARFHLAVSRATAALLAESPPEWVTVALVDEKYPQLHEVPLAGAVLGRAIPAWQRAIDSGVVILDAQAALHVQEAVTEGKPLIERRVALAGPGFARAAHVTVRIGTPVTDVISAHVDSREVHLVVGSVLSGEPVTDPPQAVDIGTSLIVALVEPRRARFGWTSPGWDSDSYSRTFAAGLLPLRKTADTGVHGEHRPCLTCNFCDRVCPAQIEPYLLHRYVQRNLIDESLLRYRIFDCIDCNLCTYVCPSKIPVARLLADGRRRMREEGLVPDAEEASQP